MTRFAEYLQRRRIAYQRTFIGPKGHVMPSAQDVLDDLKRYCGINRGGIVVSPITRTVDSHATAYRAGQRDVYLRIVKYLGLDESDIKEIAQHAGKSE